MMSAPSFLVRRLVLGLLPFLVRELAAGSESRGGLLRKTGTEDEGQTKDQGRKTKNRLLY